MLNRFALITVTLTLLLSCQSTKPRQNPILETPAQVVTTLTKRIFKPFIGDEWIGKAISYGPYREGQAPGEKGPSEEEILQDLKILGEHWNLIRVYGSDDDSERVLRVIHEHKLPIKVMLGIWLSNEIVHPHQLQNNQSQVKRGIDLANRFPDEVIAINVGNETQVFWSSHRMDPDNLIRYIREVRRHTKVPVTTADDFNFCTSNSKCSVNPVYRSSTYIIVVPVSSSVYCTSKVAPAASGRVTTNLTISVSVAVFSTVIDLALTVLPAILVEIPNPEMSEP
jgi:exo-beta-1,3-glucanase (GH17 family)